MPAFDIAIEGKKYHIEIPDPWAVPLIVGVDGEMFEVEVARGQGARRAFDPPPAASEPPVLPSPPLRDEPRPVDARSFERFSLAGAGDIVAPMPGTVLGVEVIPSQTVGAGDVLCILEAMKMKNPIRASRPGIVSEIAVVPGQTVGRGDLLVRLG